MYVASGRSRTGCKQREVDHVGPATEQVEITGSRAGGVRFGEHPPLHSVVDDWIRRVSLASAPDHGLSSMTSLDLRARFTGWGSPRQLLAHR